jgi:hypothetical protein
MTQAAKEHEHIRNAVALVSAKARKRLARLQLRINEGDGSLAGEIEELERIERMTLGAWQELNNESSTPAE